MHIIQSEIPGVLIIEPKVFGDERGFFFESYNSKLFSEMAKINEPFVQDNHSRSARHILRGLHYQLSQPQGKLVRVVVGEVYDVVVDLRKSSPTFGKWLGFHLSATNQKMVFIPKGFAHGFLVLSDFAEFLYKTTDFYHPASEKSIRYDDPDLKITWPLEKAPILSNKDSQGSFFKDAEVFE